MAQADRVAAPELPSTIEPEFPWGSVPMKLAVGADRRLEARTYLTDGYGLRQRLESIPGATLPFEDVAKLWQPGRLKGFVVAPGKGLPFMSAGQVFEDKPRIRKWIAKAMLKDASVREVQLGWLLMTISGEVGRVTAVYDEHLGKVITHDLLRIEPNDPDEFGWLYAYTRTPTFFAISRSAQYGHMIKHLEPEHVRAMPVLMPDEELRRDIGSDAVKAVTLRRMSRRVETEAQALYAEQVKLGSAEEPSTFQVRASELFGGRRRLDGEHYRSDVVAVETAVRASATNGVDRLEDVTESVSLGNRFKRFFSETGAGTPYRSASELFDVNAPVTKRVYAALLEDPDQYMLRAGWIIMARSGQTYGLLGRTLVTTSSHEGLFGSDDLIRIVPDRAKIRIGYLQTVLSHQKLGRPLVIRSAYGTSIPHLDPIDVKKTPVPRFVPEVEAKIADLAEEAIELSRQADELETRATIRAEAVIEAFLARTH